MAGQILQLLSCKESHIWPSRLPAAVNNVVASASWAEAEAAASSSATSPLKSEAAEVAASDLASWNSEVAGTCQ